MKKFWLALILPLLLISSSYSQGYLEGQDFISDGVRQPLIIHASKEEAKELKNRWQNIGEEIKRTDNVYAGTYVMTGYRGYYLRFSPENGFVYIYHYEDIDIIGYSYGRIKIKDSEITFLPKKEVESIQPGKPFNTPQTWFLIRNALVPQEKLKDYANYLAGLGQYNDFNGDCCEFSPFLFKREGKRNSDAAFPVEYEKLVENPIKAEIMYVGQKKRTTKYSFQGTLYGESKSNAVLIPVKINAGILNGVKKNMLFRLIDEPMFQYLQITKVKSREAEGTVVRTTDENWAETYTDYSDYDEETKESKEKPYPTIRVGIKVTTSPVSDN